VTGTPPAGKSGRQIDSRSMTPPARPWAEKAGAVEAGLDSGPDGISPAEAARRLERFGPNLLKEEEATGPLVIFLRQLRNPLVYILLLATLVTLALGEWVDAAVIGAVVVLNTVVGFLQEFKAEKSLEALRRLSVTGARVVRAGREREVDAAELVPGDRVVVHVGDRVPADMRVAGQTTVEIDESLLTGESLAVSKHPEPVDPSAQVADRSSMLFMGSVATRGSAEGLVTATGAATELGQIAGSVRDIGITETPLQVRMRRLTRLIAVAIFGICAVGFFLGSLHGESPTELFRAMVALAVATLPVGLPIVLTVALAIGVSRMAHRGAILRRLPAVETLGSCTVIGSDKTGTLTQNRMTVEQVFAGGESYRLTGPGYSTGGKILLKSREIQPEPDSPLELCLKTGALANEASLEPAGNDSVTKGDPTEIALLVSAAKAGLYRDRLDSTAPREADIPFDPTKRYAASFNLVGGRLLAFYKGAPERILEMCDSAAGLDEFDREAVLAEAERMAADGLRVLAMAFCDLGRTDLDPELLTRRPDGLSFLGLQGMMDPPRQEAAEAVAECRLSGIRTVMVTGDHASTALSVARRLGIVAEDQGEERVRTGSQLDRLSDEDLDGLVGDVDVFARVSPGHKLRLVEALQRVGEVVAVTGDGVNDAPALKKADIGTAMGDSGTEVAREASDMVLTDDNFASISAAVEEGRIAFANVRNTTFFLLSGNAAAVLVVLASLGWGATLPLLAVQLLWLNLVTNGVQDIALAFEPGEKGVSRQPPRPRREGVISRLLWHRIGLAAVFMAAGTLLVFGLQMRVTTVEEARTAALTALVVFQVVHVGNSRSEMLSVFSKSPISNPFLFIGTSIAMALHVGAMYFPPTQFALRLEPISYGAWVQILALSLGVVLVVELHKLYSRTLTRRVVPKASHT
jgi:magnesium-transporting ATPase (P-type)